MICSELYNGQGLGNQLWNYVVARIIAQKKGCEFSILGKDEFKGQLFMDIDFGVTLTGGASPEGGPPSKLPNGIVNYYRERRENLIGTDKDISRTDLSLLKIPAHTKFDGNCQSTRYLTGRRHDILNWIRLKNDYTQYTTDENTCVIHLRCGDFVGLKDVFLPPSYYLNAMKRVEKLNPKVKFVCVTDQKNVAEQLLPGVKIVGSANLNEKDRFMASHHHGGPIGIDFSYLMHAKYLIIPNSSFSWWAAYLNQRQKIVIAPKYWARFNVADGFWSTSDIITDGFLYADTDGNYFTAKQCWAEKTEFEANHQDSFVVTDTINAVKVAQKKQPPILNIARKINDFIFKNHTKTPPLGASEIAQYRQNIKIYDVFTFFNELELLEMHLNILAPYVDYFVIIECTETFSGLPKKLFFQENQARFKKFKHKIIHYVTNDAPASENDLRQRLQNPQLSDLDREIINHALTSDNVPKGQLHWLKEFYQKESIKKALVNLSDNDVCFVGDVDEIWNPHAMIDFSRDDIFKLKQDVYVYYLNNRSSEPWAGTLVTKYKNIKNGCLNHLRTVSKTKYTYIENGGWHFTNQGGADQIRRKLESYGHQEFNNDDIKSKIEDKISGNKDFIGRNFQFWIDQSSLPKYILDHKEKYKRFFK